jgi:hypothetical protein
LGVVMINVRFMKLVNVVNSSQQFR